MTAHDAIRVTRRSLTRQPGVVQSKHVFHAQTAQESDVALDRAAEELRRVAVLALVATFERRVRDSLIDRVKTGLADPALVDAAVEELQMWNFKQRLIGACSGVNDSLAGQVKQLIDYRNWVAHGKTTAEPAPVATNPQAAHARLSDFLRQAGMI